MENPSVANSMYADPSVHFMTELFCSQYKTIYIINTFAVVSSSGLDFCLTNNSVIKKYSNDNNASKIGKLFFNNKNSKLLIATGKVNEFNSDYYKGIIDEASVHNLQLLALSDKNGNYSGKKGFAFHPMKFINSGNDNDVYLLPIKINVYDNYQII